MKLEPPKMSHTGPGAQARQYTYFFDSKSGESFGTPTLQPINPTDVADANSWNLTITHHATTGR
ncbi:MAG TPA: hypothetical protein VLH35_01150 [Candidatus Acidoferrales bacterium]|nr:hypothetical protein [Candidatus Acidoferrales bacterium]